MPKVPAPRTSGRALSFATIGPDYSAAAKAFHSWRCHDRMPLMQRDQPLLHEAMRAILLDRPERTATLEVLSEENARRDLYRKEDGQHPEPFQFRLRARQYAKWFDLLPADRIRYIGR